MPPQRTRLIYNRLPEIAAALNPAAEEALKKGADAIAEDAKARVPVRSGKLRDAITVEDEDGGYKVVAGDTEAFYGHMVEFGTTHSPAQPFLIPAFESKRKEIEDEVGRELKKI